MRAVFFAFLVMFAVVLAPAANADVEREITRDWPAGGLDTIEIEANVGTVHVVGSDRGSISLKLRIEPQDGFWRGRGSIEEIIEAAELKEHRSGKTLVLDLSLPRSGDDDDIEEHWELQVPAAMRALVELNVGEAEIRGISGGVDAEVNVGELRIDVLEGDIDAEVNVGDLDIRSATKSPGEFDLEVNIGDVRLDIDGSDVGMDRGWLGGTLRHDAGGDDDVTAEVNVGDLGVRVD